MLAALFKGTFAAIMATDLAKASKDVPQGSAAGMIDQTVDVLPFTGTAKEIATRQKLLPQIDEAKGQVLVRGVMH